MNPLASAVASYTDFLCMLKSSPSAEGPSFIGHAVCIIDDCASLSISTFKCGFTKGYDFLIFLQTLFFHQLAHTTQPQLLLSLRLLLLCFVCLDSTIHPFILHFHEYTPFFRVRFRSTRHDSYLCA